MKFTQVRLASFPIHISKFPMWRLIITISIVKIATQCRNLYYTVLQYGDTKLTYEDRSVILAVRLY